MPFQGYLGQKECIGMYALWGLSRNCLENDIKAFYIENELMNLYGGLRADPGSNEHYPCLQKSMASFTRMKPPRVKRIKALITTLNL